MGDRIEPQITPETPGRPSIRNPFESPNDYHHLHEPLVPSPSAFKSKPSKATPAKFNWSIDELASLLPVHIDPEDIQRQSLYLSQTREDSDIEEKRQNAIEQFFTKGAIVPSPWTAPGTRKTAQKSNEKSSLSPVILEEPQSAKKLNAACQTALSLPVDFDMEKILGEYYRDEVCDGVQESLSSSSLRRKLFLDGQDSMNGGSDISNPPSPERAQPREQRPPLGRGREGAGGGGSEGEALSSILSSPLSCGVAAPTPSSGQFSSSPIQQGRFRDYSLGSITSPLFPDRSSPASLASPTVSPIGPQTLRTPIGSGERKQLSFVTPDGAGVPSDMDVNSCTESPYVEGCSPIRSCSPHQLQSHTKHHTKPRHRARCWASPPLISPILNPKLRDQQEYQLPFTSLLHTMELDPSSPSFQDALPRNIESQLGMDMLNSGVGLGLLGPVTMEEGEGAAMEDIDKEEGEGGAPVQLTSSRMGNVSAAESSQVFVSLLAEASSICYDSSMQVDSGYNTTSAGTASLIDGISPDCHGKESFSSNLMEQVFPFTRPAKVKTLYSHH